MVVGFRGNPFLVLILGVLSAAQGRPKNGQDAPAERALFRACRARWNAPAPYQPHYCLRLLPQLLVCAVDPLRGCAHKPR